MYKQTIISSLLILCALGVRAEDSIKVSATDLQVLMQRVERLEQKAEQDSISPKMVKGERLEVKGERERRFWIGGYGEVTAKHCFYSNNYLRYGKNP